MIKVQNQMLTSRVSFYHHTMLYRSRGTYAVGGQSGQRQQQKLCEMLTSMRPNDCVYNLHGSAHENDGDA